MFICILFSEWLSELVPSLPHVVYWGNWDSERVPSCPVTQVVRGLDASLCDIRGESSAHSVGSVGRAPSSLKNHFYSTLDEEIKQSRGLVMKTHQPLSALVSTAPSPGDSPLSAEGDCCPFLLHDVLQPICWLADAPPAISQLCWQCHCF